MKNGQEVVRAISRCGGISDTATLIRLTSRTQLENATIRGLIVRDARGRYALPDRAGRTTRRQPAHRRHVPHHRRRPLGMGDEAGTSAPHSHRAPKAKDPSQHAGDVDVFWRTFAAGPILPGQVTPPLQTVIDCARWLPFDEALAIADSALRHRSVTREELSAARSRTKGRGSSAVIRVLGAADGRADNPFESALRAISMDIPGLLLVPQVEIRGTGRRMVRPDLVDELAEDHR